MIDLGTLKIGVKVDKDGAFNDLESMKNTSNQLEQKFTNLGKVLVGAFSVKAIVDFGKKAVEASAELQAMGAQFDQVFKEDNAQAVDRISKQVDDLGIHADRLTSSWNSFGGQIKGAGMEGEQALEAVEKATRLAADSAAFYDRSLEDSTGALASFMKGNFAAGDSIGVFTNAKQMDIRSNEMYGKSWADLSESERQWLLLDTVEKTYEMNGAMGQAARESKSYENVMGNLRATFQRLWAVIGEPVLEVFLGVVQNVTTWIEGNMPLIETTVKGIFEGIKEAWVTVLQPTLSILWDIFKGILGWVTENWPLISGVIKTAFTVVQTVWNNVLSPVLSAVMDVFGVILDIVSKNFPAIQTIFENVFGAIGGIISTAVKAFEGLIAIVKKAIDYLKNWKELDAQASKNTDTYKSSAGGRRDGYTHAAGIDYVPYDGYVATLHKGERVVPALEANKPQTINHSGTIKVQGVNNQGELTAVVDIVMDQLRREVRLA